MERNLLECLCEVLDWADREHDGQVNFMKAAGKWRGVYGPLNKKIERGLVGLLPAHDTFLGMLEGMVK